MGCSTTRTHYHIDLSTCTSLLWVRESRLAVINRRIIFRHTKYFKQVIAFLATTMSQADVLKTLKVNHGSSEAVSCIWSFHTFFCAMCAPCCASMQGVNHRCPQFDHSPKWTSVLAHACAWREHMVLNKGSLVHMHSGILVKPFKHAHVRACTCMHTHIHKHKRAHTHIHALHTRTLA